MVSKGRGYEFDVCAWLEISTTTHLSIFSQFFPKISKSDDCTWMFYCLKWRPGQNKKFGELFSKILKSFRFFSVFGQYTIDNSKHL